MTTEQVRPFLTRHALADRWCMNPGSLANMTAAGIGPAITRVGRKVLYALADVEAYEAANRSEYAA